MGNGACDLHFYEGRELRELGRHAASQPVVVQPPARRAAREGVPTARVTAIHTIRAQAVMKRCARSYTLRSFVSCASSVGTAPVKWLPYRDLRASRRESQRSAVCVCG